MGARGGRGTKTLGELVGATAGATLVAGDAGTPIAAITHDSRSGGQNALFVARPGQRYDGTAFVAEAMARGAVAVVSERAVPMVGTAWVHVANARAALADLATAWR